ncbi:hypothetical protein [Pseudonocardia sp. NPDC046786]|uniref:hypothetical protein n=1 Tax=Pseudonocardia sp. NPDC046786 TaxID=3155471 RepID=UPI0034075E2F
MRSRAASPCSAAASLIVITALGPDSRILRSWELELSRERRLTVPHGTRTVHVGAAGTVHRVRVELGRRRRRG